MNLPGTILTKTFLEQDIIFPPGWFPGRPNHRQLREVTAGCDWWIRHVEPGMA